MVKGSSKNSITTHPTQPSTTFAGFHLIYPTFTYLFIGYAYTTKIVAFVFLAMWVCVRACFCICVCLCVASTTYFSACILFHFDGHGIFARVAHCLNYFYGINFPFSRWICVLQPELGIRTVTVKLAVSASALRQRHAKAIDYFEDIRVPCSPPQVCLSLVLTPCDCANCKSCQHMLTDT